jgi:hypothetical protein
MNPNEVERPRAAGFVAPAGALALGLAAVIAACSSGSPPQSQTPPDASAPKAAAQIAPERPKRLHAHRGHRRVLENERCPEVTVGQIYRQIDGIDICPQLMSASDLAKEFNDPWGKNVLTKLVGTADLPTDFDSIVNTATRLNSDLQRHATLLGEGGQMSKAPDHGLRFVITWGDADFKSAQLFFSARPPAGGGQPRVLEVIGFDSKKQKLNFFHYEGSSLESTAKAWIWAGDSSHAQDPNAGGKGCFTCHLDGGLNMKELTFPWNNWQSAVATIDPALLGSNDPLVTQHLLKDELRGADKFEPIVRATNTTITTNWVKDNSQNNNISKAALKAVLARLFGTSTINMASSGVSGSGTEDLSSLPNDFFLFDTALRDPQGINLAYTKNAQDLSSPGDLQIGISRAAYNAFLTKYNVEMADPENKYEQPGGTFFPFFVPTPPYEDAVAIRAMIQQKIVSSKFAAAALMVDLQNPIFSEVRKSLLAHVDKMSEGHFVLDQNDFPRRFMELVTLASLGQPQCKQAGTAGVQGINLDSCTAEQQLVYWWSRPDATWKDDFKSRIQTYVDVVKGLAGKPDGAEQYLKLMIARGDQFSHNPVVCNLDEFSLLLPTTSLDQGLRQQSWQMKLDGTIAQKAAYNGCTDP